MAAYFINFIYNSDNFNVLYTKLKFSSWNDFTSNIGSDFKTSGDRFIVWYKMGCIVVISFYLTTNKDFSTWTDHSITRNHCLPVPVLGMSSVDSIYLGTCWTQANTTQFPLVQITNMGNVVIRTMNASYKNGESFRGTFCYITAE